jgi:hypothetical protein
LVVDWPLFIVYDWLGSGDEEEEEEEEEECRSVPLFLFLHQLLVAIV